MKKLQIFTTGGTVDKVYFDALSEFQIGEPVVGPVRVLMSADGVGNGAGLRRRGRRFPGHAATTD